MSHPFHPFLSVADGRSGLPIEILSAHHFPKERLRPTIAESVGQLHGWECGGSENRATTEFGVIFDLERLSISGSKTLAIRGMGWRL